MMHAQEWVPPLADRRAPTTPRSHHEQCTCWFKQNASNCVVIHECHMFGILLTAMNIGRAWPGRFFSWGPRAGTSVEHVSQPTIGHFKLKWTITFRRFRRNTYHVSFFFFPNQPVPSTPRHACKTFRASIQRSDCVGANIKWFWMPKADHILKLSNYYLVSEFEATPYSCTFTAQKSQYLRRFFWR